MNAASGTSPFEVSSFGEIMLVMARERNNVVNKKTHNTG